jgi:hypothetical protein
MKYIGRKVKDMNSEERSAYGKSIFRRIVERNGEVLKKISRK